MFTEAEPKLKQLVAGTHNLKYWFIRDLRCYYLNLMFAQFSRIQFTG